MKKLKILLFALTLLTLFPTAHQAQEKDTVLFFLDREPWKISWIQESENRWVLLANFDKGEAKTYFKRQPPTKGLGLTMDNKPYRQEFKYYPAGKTFISKNPQFEQWPDGAKAYSFSYDKSFTIAGKKYEMGVITIVEEVENAPHEVRYSIFKKYD